MRSLLYSLIAFIISFNSYANEPNQCSRFFKVNSKYIENLIEKNSDSASLVKRQEPIYDLSTVKTLVVPALSHRKYSHRLINHYNLNPVEWGVWGLTRTLRFTARLYKRTKEPFYLMGDREMALDFSNSKNLPTKRRYSNQIETLVKEIERLNKELDVLNLDFSEMEQGGITNNKHDMLLSLTSIRHKELEIRESEWKKEDIEKKLQELKKNPLYEKPEKAYKSYIRKIDKYEAEVEKRILESEIGRYRALSLWRAWLKLDGSLTHRIKNTRIVFGKERTNSGKWVEVVYLSKNTRQLEYEVTLPKYVKGGDVEWEIAHFKDKWAIYTEAWSQAMNSFIKVGWGRYGMYFNRKSVVKVENDLAAARAKLNAFHKVLDHERKEKGTRFDSELKEILDEIKLKLEESDKKYARRSYWWLNRQMFYAEVNSMHGGTEKKLNALSKKYFGKSLSEVKRLEKKSFKQKAKLIGLPTWTLPYFPITLLKFGIPALGLSSMSLYYIENISNGVHSFARDSSSWVESTVAQATGNALKIADIAHKKYDSEKQYYAARNAEIKRLFGDKFMHFSEGEMDKLSPRYVNNLINISNQFSHERNKYWYAHAKFKNVKARDQRLNFLHYDLMERLSEVSTVEAAHIVSIAKISNNEVFAEEATNFIKRVSKTFDFEANPEKLEEISFPEVEQYILDVLHALKVNKDEDKVFLDIPSKISDLNLGVRGKMILRAMVEDKYNFEELRKTRFGFKTESILEEQLLEHRLSQMGVYLFNEYIKGEFGEKQKVILEKYVSDEKETMREFFDKDPLLMFKVQSGEYLPDFEAIQKRSREEEKMKKK